MMRDHFDRLLRIQNLCKALGIKLIMTHLLSLVEYHCYFETRNKDTPVTWSDLERAMSEVSNHSDVDPKTIIGWPHFESIKDGYFIIDPWGRNGWDQETMMVGPKDEHPNGLGHQHIAEKFYEHYQKNFTKS
jgi:hypothetical protein